jgi:hypothetical protein
MGKHQNSSMTRTAKLFFGLLFLGMAAVSLFPQAAQAAQAELIQCGRGTDVNSACHLCDLVKGVSILINYMRTIMVYISLTVITAMGILYIVSTGDEGMIKTAKDGIKYSLVGIVIILSAWLIVNTVMFYIFDANLGNVGVKATFNVSNGFQFDCDETL